MRSPLSSHVPYTYLHDAFSTQKILKNARLAEAGVIHRDPLKESIGLQLDMINILCVTCPLSRECAYILHYMIAASVLSKFSVCSQGRSKNLIRARSFSTFYAVVMIFSPHLMPCFRNNLDKWIYNGSDNQEYTSSVYRRKYATNLLCPDLLKHE